MITNFGLRREGVFVKRNVGERKDSKGKEFNSNWRGEGRLYLGTVAIK